MIIDFEYCAYNYRGFDVANHMVEWTMDYTNKAFPFYHHRIGQYPSREQQEHFVTAYLRSMVVANGGPEDYQPSAKEIGELLDEVRCFRMASHLFWTLWAIVNVHQDIEFGYWVRRRECVNKPRSLIVIFVSDTGLWHVPTEGVHFGQRGVQQSEGAESETQAHTRQAAVSSR